MKKPKWLKRAKELELDGPLYVHVTAERTPGNVDLTIDAAYNQQELVATGEKAVVGVYELVGLQEIEGIETVTIKDIR
jgi:hypothetical protein